MTCYARLAILLSLLTVTACSVRGTDIEPVRRRPPPRSMPQRTPRWRPRLPVDAWWTTFGDARVTTLVERRSVEALTHVRRGRW